MPNTAQKHEWVAQHNWDDGFDPIWPIVDDEETEFATALMIYWRLDGPWFVDGSSDEAKQLHDTVVERLTTGFYSNRHLKYYPVEDNRLSKTQVYKLLKAGIPDELISPIYTQSNESTK